jgi:hypothetical protein
MKDLSGFGVTKRDQVLLQRGRTFWRQTTLTQTVSTAQAYSYNGGVNLVPLFIFQNEYRISRIFPHFTESEVSLPFSREATTGLVGHNASGPLLPIMFKDLS